MLPLKIRYFQAVCGGGYEAIVISIYGAEGFGGDNVRIYIKETETGNPSEGEMVTLKVVEGEWRTYLIPVSEFTMILQ